MLERIDQQVRFAGVLGDPIAHSLSPRLHNAAFSHVGLAVIYLPIRVEKAQLKAVIGAGRRMNFVGFNVTLPLKEEAARLADELLPDAQRIGAVNTLVFGPDGVTGANTDRTAFCSALAEDAGFDPKGKAVLVLGAGGAARAAIDALAAGEAREIVICNRTVKRAREVAKAFAKFYPQTTFNCVPWQEPDVRSAAGSCSLIVQTTAVGVKTTDVKWPFQWRAISENTLLYDFNYGANALFLRQAPAGLRKWDGTGLFVRQAAESFRLWTGRDVPLEVFRQAMAV